MRYAIAWVLGVPFSVIVLWFLGRAFGLLTINFIT
jgi:hypothetical protein